MDLISTISSAVSLARSLYDLYDSIEHKKACCQQLFDRCNLFVPRLERLRRLPSDESMRKSVEAFVRLIKEVKTSCGKYTKKSYISRFCEEVASGRWGVDFEGFYSRLTILQQDVVFALTVDEALERTRHQLNMKADRAVLQKKIDILLSLSLDGTSGSRHSAEAIKVALRDFVDVQKAIEIEPILASTAASAHSTRSLASIQDLKNRIKRTDETLFKPEISKLREDTEIGQGVFSEVHRAEYNNVPVAVKKLKGYRHFSEHDQRLLIREVLILQKLKHPNIISSPGADIDQGYIVLELAQCTLFTFLHRKDQLPTGFPETLDRLGVLLDMASALRYLHFHGIIHRDIKPANVLLFQGRRVMAKLCDFGLSTASNMRSVVQSRWRGGLVGTFAFMAPECFEPNVRHTSAVDVFGWALTGNEMYTGDITWVGMHDAEIMTTVLVNKLRPTLFTPSSSQEKEKVLNILFGNANSGCLHQDPKKRPAMEDCLKALEAQSSWWSVILSFLPSSDRTQMDDSNISDPSKSTESFTSPDQMITVGTSLTISPSSNPNGDNANPSKKWLGVPTAFRGSADASRNSVRFPFFATEKALRVACQKGSLEEVKYLVSNGVNVNCKSKKGGSTPLHGSAINGHLEVVKYLLQQGADIRCKDKDGGTPLHGPAWNGQLEVVKYLLEQGADIHCKDKDGRAPLHRSACNGQLEVVKYLLEKGADIHCKDKDGRAPLHRSACNGQLEVVKCLLEKGADIHCETNDGRTALHWSAINGHLEVVKYLLQQGADIHCKDNDGWSPLHWSAREDQLYVVKYLLEQRADIGSKDNDGQSPIHRSASNGHSAVVKCLHQQGADIHCKDWYDKTPIHLSATNGHLEVVKYLLQQGADIHCKDKGGNTPFHLSATNGHLEVMKYLLQRGARKNEDDSKRTDRTDDLLYLAAGGWLTLVQRGNSDFRCMDKDGNTPLLLSAMHGHLEVVKCLHQKGADIGCKNKIGWTPLHWSAFDGRFELVKYLHQQGVDIHCKTNVGLTPLHLSSFDGHLEVVTYLLQQGADRAIKDKNGHIPYDVIGSWHCEDVKQQLRSLLQLKKVSHKLMLS